MTTCADLQTRLDALTAARDNIALGTKVVRLRHGEKELQYGSGDGARLDQLIREVRLDMARLGCDGCRRRGRIVLFEPSDGGCGSPPW